MKNRFLLLFLIFLSTTGWGFEFRKTQDKLYLSGGCKEVNEMQNRLLNWHAKVSGPQISSSSQCRPQVASHNMTNAKICKIDVSECVPKEVLQYYGKTSKENGPNCFNLSLLMTKTLPHLRYTGDEEMAFYLKSPLCRQLNLSEKKQPGDVGIVRRDRGADTLDFGHSFIHIDDRMVFTKNGYEKNVPYEIQDTNKMMASYNVPLTPVCRENRVTDMDRCDGSTEYYRCTSMQSYLKKSSQVPAEINAAFVALTANEKCLQDAVLGKKKLDAKFSNNLYQIGQTLVTYFNDMENKPAFKSLPQQDQDFFVGSLRMRLKSIADQLHLLAGDGSLTKGNHLRDRAYLIENTESKIQEAYEGAGP